MIASRVAYFPDEGWVEPVRLVAALLSMARASGATLRPQCAAVGMSMTGDRIDGVRICDGETLRTDAVVNCAGPGAGEVAALGSGTADAAVSIHHDGSRTVEPRVVQAMLHLAEELYPGLRGRHVETSRIGVRPIPIDGLPVLGASATVENFHFAVTHSGVTLCLRVAELIGAEIRGEQVDELTPFRHSRLNAGQSSQPNGLPSARSPGCPLG